MVFHDTLSDVLRRHGVHVFQVQDDGEWVHLCSAGSQVETEVETLRGYL